MSKRRKISFFCSGRICFCRIHAFLFSVVLLVDDQKSGLALRQAGARVKTPPKKDLSPNSDFWLEIILFEVIQPRSRRSFSYQDMEKETTGAGYEVGSCVFIIGLKNASKIKEPTAKQIILALTITSV